MTVLEGEFTLLVQRIIWLSNAIFRKVAYRNFVRHPEVDDYTTNIQIGQGFGLARTIDPLTQIFRVVRYLGPDYFRYRKNFSIIDLGCGDGFMLRGFEFAGFRNLSGIEIDNELAELASRNIPSASILCLDFSSPAFSKALAQKSYIAVFTFNPAPAEQLVSALVTLAINGSYVLFLRNPKSWPAIAAAQDLKTEILGSPKNMIVARVSTTVNI